MSIDTQRLHRAFYIQMRDGVRLAAELFLPSCVMRGVVVPTVLSLTRYWRAAAFGAPLPEALDYFRVPRRYNERDFACMIVDVRGTGASFGSRATEYSRAEIDDDADVLSWIQCQPCSNGKVGTTGSSYAGNTAELAQVVNHPALRAVVPRQTDFDVYEHLLFPGGLRNIAFASPWGRTVRNRDRNVVEFLDAVQPDLRPVLGVKPVDEDIDGALLREAVAEHEANVHFADVFKLIEFRDDVEDNAKVTPAVDIYRLRAELEAGARPAYHWASWMDGGTAAGALARFATFNTPMVVRIGTWNHRAQSNGDPFAADASVEPAVTEQHDDVMAFLDEHLRGEDTPSLERQIVYASLNDAGWNTTTTWPPSDVKSQSVWLGPGYTLALIAPQGEGGTDSYIVDFDVGTGLQTRWTTQIGTAIRYEDRAAMDKRLLAYTSAPLRADAVITGDPLIHLFVESTHADGAFIVYLSAVSPAGTVTYITEGSLRAIHRRTVDAPAPYIRSGPFRTFRRKDSLPLPSRQVTELTFPLLPTSVRIAAGDAIRISIAGADRDTFERCPSEGTPTIAVHRSELCASYVELPVQGDPQLW